MSEPRIPPSTDFPQIGVHELSQFVFCPRAGIITRESRVEDTGIEGRPLRLGYLPQYHLGNIESTLAHAIILLLVLLGIGVLALIGAGTAALGGYSWLGIFSQLTLLLILAACVVDFCVVGTLVVRRRRALGTPPREPIFFGDAVIPIHWWELRAAGFSPRSFPSILRDEDLGMNGHPWVVLARGTECIPVLRMMGKNRGVYPNHSVRVAAYCHLIEATTNCDSPYGIALLPNSLEALAVPYTESLKGRLGRAIDEARSTIASDEPPEAPANKQKCLSCPLGIPRKYVYGKTDTQYQGQPVAPLTVEVDGKRWHCACGDLFRWKTPAIKSFANITNDS